MSIVPVKLLIYTFDVNRVVHLIVNLKLSPDSLYLWGWDTKIDFFEISVFVPLPLLAFTHL